MADLRATKNCCNITAKQDEFEITGYLHNLSMDPYGFILFSEIQYQIWNHVRESNSIWFFDATGSIHKKVFDQPKPYFYSMVCRDSEKKLIIPVAEFLTTQNDEFTIDSYLRSIKHKIELVNMEAMPQIIVTDQSRVLQNAVLNVFNSMTFEKYIAFCFDIVTNTKELSNAFVVYYTCSTHLLKNIIKSSKSN